MDSFQDDAKIELEDQFILRVPPVEAEAIRNALSKKSKKFKKVLKIEMEENMRTGTVYVNKKPLNAMLIDLPTITESYKLIDNVNLYKTADICQMLVCSYGEIERQDVSEKKKYGHHHGLAPPLKNVKKFRFRKTLRNKNDIQESADIEKEILMLLRMDNEAISTRYEFFYENDNKNGPHNSKESEKTIFGDLSDTEESSSTENNDIMDFTR